MFCVYCGNEIEEYMQYCPNCGKQRQKSAVRTVCAKCGSKVDSSYSFCVNCGSPIGDEKNAEKSSAEQLFSNKRSGASNTVECSPDEKTTSSESEKLVYCNFCGNSMNSTAQFCPNCGKRRTMLFEQFCSRCGSKVGNGDRFCINCGSSLNGGQNTEKSSAGHVVLDSNIYNSNKNEKNSTNRYESQVFCECIQKNVVYYQQKFREMECSGSIVSWNVPAALVTPCWFAYRKMWGWSFGYLAINIASSLFLPAWLCIGLQVICMLIFGMVGNYIYKNKIDNFLEHFLKEKIEDESDKEYIRGETGADAGCVVAYLFLAVLLQVVLYFVINVLPEMW